MGKPDWFLSPKLPWLLGWPLLELHGMPVLGCYSAPARGPTRKHAADAAPISNLKLPAASNKIGYCSEIDVLDGQVHVPPIEIVFLLDLTPNQLLSISPKEISYQTKD